MNTYQELRQDFDYKTRVLSMAQNQILNLNRLGIVLLILSTFSLFSWFPGFVAGVIAGIVCFVITEYSKEKHTPSIIACQNQVNWAKDSLIRFLRETSDIPLDAEMVDEDGFSFKILRVVAPNAIEIHYKSSLVQIVGKEYIMRSIKSGEEKRPLPKNYFPMPTRYLEDYEGRDLTLFTTLDIQKTLAECSQLDTDMMDAYNVHIFYQLDTEFKRRVAVSQNRT